MPEVSHFAHTGHDDDPQIARSCRSTCGERASRQRRIDRRADVEILSDEAIDLLVLDLRLAGDDGMVIARSLREKSSIPIVMLTGVRDEADRVMGLELGADDI